MNTCRILLASLFLALPTLARDPAQVTLFSQSLRFSTGNDQNMVATLQLTRDSSFGELNGEFFPVPGDPDYGAYFQLDDPTLDDSVRGRLQCYTPQFADANGDGWDDFFQSSQGVAKVSTSGLFETPVDNGSVTATWTRPAGSATGTCVMRLVGDMFGQLPDFTFTFELLEYKGALSYTPTTNSITGPLRLTKTGDPASTLAGNLTFIRTTTNRFDFLSLQGGTLTNAAGQPLPFANAQISRDTKLGTNYYGLITSTDGEPSTSTPDFLDWLLSMDDPNDLNKNGIPDFSDDPTGGSGRQPRLSLIRSGNQLLLSVSADAGSGYQLQETASLAAPTLWGAGVSLTLTNDPQTVPITLPSAATKFWRVTAP